MAKFRNSQATRRIIGNWTAAVVIGQRWTTYLEMAIIYLANHAAHG